MDEQQAKLVIQRNLALEKAFRSGDANTIYKAERYYKQLLNKVKPSNDGMKSLVIDPDSVSSSMGYFHKATNLSFEALRAMARTPIIAAIINTRKDQIAEYCKPQADRYSKGFIFKKKGVPNSEDLSDEDKKIQDRLTQFILSCGESDREWDLDDFEPFVRKIIGDSLTMDQGCFEIIPTRAFTPYSFAAVDAATFRIAPSYDNDQNTEGARKVRGYFPSYVQIYQSQVIREFYPWELCFGIRNPTTNIYANGYGRSELEDLIGIVTSMLNSDKYNGNFFRHGSAPKGALMVKKGNINQNLIDQLRRDWNAMMSGVDGAHKTPILDADSVEWLDMQKTNRDMEFSKFQEYLIKIACACYKISPEEIGFPMQGTHASGLGSKEGGKQEKEYSMEKGLRPLLTTIQGWINKFIIGPKTNKLWEFQFAGIDNETAAEEENRLTKASQTYMEVNEIRIAKGLKPKPGYDVILNPVITQIKQMEMQNQQQLGEKFEQQDQEQFDNTNPFLQKGDNDPFEKAFNNWCETNLLVK